MSIVRLADFESDLRDARALASVAMTARSGIRHAESALDKCDAAEDSDPLYHWAYRSAIAQAAVEILMTHLKAILADAEPAKEAV